MGRLVENMEQKRDFLCYFFNEFNIQISKYTFNIFVSRMVFNYKYMCTCIDIKKVKAGSLPAFYFNLPSETNLIKHGSTGESGFLKSCQRV